MSQDAPKGGAERGVRVDQKPFSRPFAVDELLRRPDEPLTISAEPEELEALARADGVPAIASLSGEFTVNRQGRDIRVTGVVRARVTQECVVTLEPFDSDVEEPVDVRFAFATAVPAPRADQRNSAQRGAGQRMSRRRGAQAQEESRLSGPAPAFASHDEDDPPDPIVDGKIDLGALAAEFMALGLDPYPRKPGVAFESIEDEDEGGESPFADLARLRKDQ